MAIHNKSITANNVNTAFKNRIIGGDFTINPWQRGTSLSVTNANNNYIADRFYYGNNTTGIITVSRDTDAPTAAQAGYSTRHSINITVTTAQATLTGTQYGILVHPIEDYNTCDLGFGNAGTRYCTLSFWIKSNKTGKISTILRSANNSRSFVAEVSINNSATWEKKIVTFPVDTDASANIVPSGVIGNYIVFCYGNSGLNGTANSWQSGVLHGAGNNINIYDSVNNYVKIALVQFEAGANATQFETRSRAQELALCQRYYYEHTGAITGGIVSTSNVITRNMGSHPVPMRTAPVVAIPSAISFYDGGNISAFSSFANGLNVSTTTSFQFDCNVTAAMAVGRPATRLLDYGGKITVSAEY